MWPTNGSTLKRAHLPGVRVDHRSAAGGCILGVALMVFSSPGPAQVGACVPGLDFGVGPALLDNTEGERRLGAELSASACSSGHDLRRADGGGRGEVEFTPPKAFPFSWTLGLDARFSLIHDGDLVPVENRVAGRAGISLSASSPAEPVDCDALNLSDEACARRMVEVGATKFDLGFAALSVSADYESSLGFSEQNLAGGAEFRYGHLRGYIPSIVVSYDAVMPLESDTRQGLGVDDDLYWRWMVQAYVYHQIGRVIGELEAAAYRANGLAASLDALGWDDGEYAVGTLSVITEWRPFGVFTVDQVYVRYSDGRVPTVPAGGNSWGVGVELRL